MGRSTIRHLIPSHGWHWRLASVAPLVLAVSAFCLIAADDPSESLDAREQLDRMMPIEKQQLARNQERFLGLDAVEQARLRDLHAAIESDPDAEQLRRVMRRYYDWLKTLDTSNRFNLALLPTEKRIERIKQIRAWQAQQALLQDEFRNDPRHEMLRRWLPKFIDRPNAEKLALWIREYPTSHGKKFPDALSASIQRRLDESLEHEQDPSRRRQLSDTAWLWNQLQGDGDPSKQVKGVLEDLREQLSAESLKGLEEDVSLEPQDKMLVLLRTLSFYRLFQDLRWRDDAELDRFLDAELAEFLDDEISPEDEIIFFNSPPEYMRQQLFVMYCKSKFPDLEINWRPGAGFGGGRPPYTRGPGPGGMRGPGPGGGGRPGGPGSGGGGGARGSGGGGGRGPAGNIPGGRGGPGGSGRGGGRPSEQHNGEDGKPEKGPPSAENRQPGGTGGSPVHWQVLGCS